MTEPLFLPPWFHVQGLELELIALFSPYTCALLSFYFILASVLSTAPFLFTGFFALHIYVFPLIR